MCILLSSLEVLQRPPTWDAGLGDEQHFAYWCGGRELQGLGCLTLGTPAFVIVLFKMFEKFWKRRKMCLQVVLRPASLSHSSVQSIPPGIAKVRPVRCNIYPSCPFSCSFFLSLGYVSTELIEVVMKYNHPHGFAWDFLSELLRQSRLWCKLCSQASGGKK